MGNDRGEAEQLAREHNQLAIFDIGRKKTINVSQ
jgi:hypothetical protein